MFSISRAVRVDCTTLEKCCLEPTILTKKVNCGTILMKAFPYHHTALPELALQIAQYFLTINAEMLRNYSKINQFVSHLQTLFTLTKTSISFLHWWPKFQSKHFLIASPDWIFQKRYNGFQIINGSALLTSLCPTEKIRMAVAYLSCKVSLSCVMS